MRKLEKSLKKPGKYGPVIQLAIDTAHMSRKKNQYRPTDTRESSSYNTAGLEDTTNQAPHGM